jgi:hypothetical protein
MECCATHQCRPPFIYKTTQQYWEGDVWMCDCGRRYVAKSRQGAVGRMRCGTLHWERRLIPWPPESWMKEI